MRRTDENLFKPLDYLCRFISSGSKRLSSDERELLIKNVRVQRTIELRLANVSMFVVHVHFFTYSSRSSKESPLDPEEINLHR